MTLAIELRPREVGGRVEIHAEPHPVAPVVSLIVYSARPHGCSFGLTDVQAGQLAGALVAVLSPADLSAVFEALEARAAGALGKNTDTDSQGPARHERDTDWPLSAEEPELPLVSAA